MERHSEAIYAEILDLRSKELSAREKLNQNVKLICEYQEALRAELQKALETVPFVLACEDCDADSPETYEEAITAGWKDITPDDGSGWNFMGTCLDCLDPEY